MVKITEKNHIEIFNLDEHIKYRKGRHEKIDKPNPNLLGLATVEINPTELCNRVCSFCPRSDPNVYPNRKLHMSTTTAQLLVDQLESASFRGDIHITGFGEPLLNPNILEIIKICSNKFHTEVITNGDRIKTGKISLKQLKEAGLNLLLVDCYDNQEQTKFFESLLSKSDLKYKIRNHYDNGSLTLIEEYGYNNRGGALYDTKTRTKSCFLPMYKSFVDWNGDVLLCCNDWFRNQTPFGNIYKETFNNIWMNKSFVDVRKNLLEGERSCLGACKNCDVNGTLYGDESAILWKDYCNQ